MTTEDKFDIDRIATGIVSVFPTLDLFEQRLSLELYRRLAEGNPVARPLLAERLGVSVEIVDQVLNWWPGVFSDPQGNIVGYWGLAIATAYTSPHQLTVDGRSLVTWCAWDTLFLPHLLGKSAEVESQSPGLAGFVKLIVTPSRVARVEPQDAHLSFLMPDAAGVQKDIVTAFCHFVHFFPSRIAGEEWPARHPGTFILSVEKAHAIALRKNRAQYGEVLRCSK